MDLRNSIVASLFIGLVATVCGAQNAQWTPNSPGSVNRTNETPLRVASRPVNRAPTRSNRSVGPIGSEAISSLSRSGKLPNVAGQVWQEYDISSFTKRLRDQDHPEQAVIDWILRETGTNTWFGEPMGVLSANDEVVRVYHTPEIQAVVKGVIDRFLNSRSEANEVAVRLVTVDRPDWRVKALSMLTPVQTQTPGIEAWLMSRENAALLLHALSERGDFQEHNTSNLTIYSGQTHTIRSTRPRIFPASTNPSNSTWRGNANLDQVNEGFLLEISPLVAADSNAIEAVIKCSVNQVERLTKLRVHNVDQFGMYRQSKIQVPQISSWQLHERFRWPTNEVLLISRGLVATPGPTASNHGVNKLFGRNAPRADALLFLESRSEIRTTEDNRSLAARTDAANYRGRY